MWKEIPLFLRLVFFIRKENTFGHRESKERILIVNPCLIGDFAASIPAISDFIKKNTDKKIDIVVSPPLKELALKVRGIENVYAAESIFNRSSENSEHTIEKIPEYYDEIMFLRASPGIFKILKHTSASKIRTGAKFFSKYGIHLLISIILRRKPKQWSEINFEMLGREPRNVPFEEIFEFQAEDYEKIKKFKEINFASIKIIIHTGSSWPMMHWENDKWINLLEKINEFGKFEFIFVGSGEKDTKDYIYISASLNFKTISLISKTNILELVMLMRSSEYFIGIDSGPANIAHLSGLRSVVIYGPGPHMFMPCDPNDIVIDKSRSRGLYQRFFTKKGGFIQKITPEETFEAFKRVYSNK